MLTIRSIAERLARHAVLRRHIRVLGQLEPLYVSPDAQLKYLRPGAASFDLDLVSVAERFVRSGDTVWDVGSNVGTFLVSAAACAGDQGQVLAVEADIWLANVLLRTVALKRHRSMGRSMRVLCAAISDSAGLEEFQIAARGRASNSLSRADQQTQLGGVRYMQPVATLSLDDLYLREGAPNFVKIDVEGAEHLVMRGARRLLDDGRPMIFIEVSRNNFAEIVDIARQSAYTLLDEAGEIPKTPTTANYYLVPDPDRVQQVRSVVGKTGSKAR